MPTPSAFVPHPDPWAIAVIAASVLFGLVAGHIGGRLVPLFGPARPREHVPADVHGAVSPGADEGTTAGTDKAVAPPAPRGDDEGPPPPRCPHCRAELVFCRWFPLVVDRCFRIRGACPHCEQTVRSHPGVLVLAVLGATLVGLTALRDPVWTPLWIPAGLWLVAVGAVLSVVDLRVQRLPDVIVRPSYPVAAALIAAAVLLPPGGPHLHRATDALIGMVLVTVLYWLLWRVRPGGLGFGDVKLSGLSGLYAGWAAGPLGALTAVFWAFAAFSAVGLVLLALRRLSHRDPFPLGPFMCATALATVLAARPLMPAL
ncbi:A24 family peptidase [Nocardiopsis sp. N85]|uniref:prepilin peptidase n=1 Tax=Nocardiopsis sp. N85 TaxID=3029400 RepID=UPI00237F3E9F|nr:A24 family peptidase [Nocardiopsis sp. N85]MDE3720237.1 A24 family peptidase [Nocardiopsis sp. N85]